MQSALVTGGAGFIGSHLAQRFAREGFAVRVLDNLSSGHVANLEGIPNLTFLEGDVRDQALVARAVEGCRFVCHQAAMVSVPESVDDPISCHEINGTGTLNVLRACVDAGVERVTFAASAAAYGNSEVLPKREQMAPDPVSPYAATKLLGEHYCSVFTQSYGLPCVPLRYFNIYGSRQDPSGAYAAVISKFVEVMGAGRAPTVFGDGLQSRDFCHVSDVVAANWAALHAPASEAGVPVNVGTGRRVTLLDLIDTLNALLGTSLVPTFGAPRAGDVRHSQADVTRARERLGFEASMTLHDGLAELLASVRLENA